MTREETIRKVLDTVLWTGNASDDNKRILTNALIKALELEEESVLDKIKDEIMGTGAYEQEVHGKTEFLKGIDYCLHVIDMYTTESEGDK